MVTPLGVALLVVAAIVAGRRRGYVRLMAVSGGMPIGVSVVAAGQSLPVFYTLAVFAFLGVITAQLLRREVRNRPAVQHVRPGALALVLFTGWSIAVTIVGPTLFSGISVLIARKGIDEQFLDPGTLGYTVSNLAQVFYLLVGVGTVFFVSKSPGATPALLGFTLGTLTILSFWRLLSIQYGLPFPAGFFDNSTAVRIIETTSTGAHRFRGIFSEPSSLASTSLTAIVYFAMRLKWLEGWQRSLAIAVLVMAVINAVESTAGTFVAAGLVLLGVLVAFGFWSFVVRGARVNPFVVVGVLLALAIGLFAIPALVDVISGVINEKVGSSSYESRTGVDKFSYLLALQTWGIGVGLGSNRPASFTAMLVSCVGVPGTLFFVVAIFTLIRRSYALPQYRATAWALVSILISKSISGPNLSDPSALLWITSGILARASWYPLLAVSSERYPVVDEAGGGTSQRLRRPRRMRSTFIPSA